LLIFPHFLISYNADHVTLTINSMIQATDSIELNAQKIEEDLSKLQTAIKHSSNIPREQATTPFSINENRPASEWMSMVANVIEKIRQGTFEKVVLARDIQLVLDDPSEMFD